MNQPRSARLAIWAPTAFAAFLVLMRLVGGTAADPAFFSFLPMCFFFVAITQGALLRRIESLEGGQESSPREPSGARRPATSS